MADPAPALIMTIYSPETQMRPIVLGAIGAALACSLLTVHAAAPAEHEPYGIDLEGFSYPYPVNLMPVVDDGEQLRMAYMDVAPTRPNGPRAARSSWSGPATPVPRSRRTASC